MRVMGFTEFAARLPSFLGALLTLLLVYAVARQLYGRVAALWSAIVLLSCAGFFFISGFVLTEMTLTLFVTAAMVSLALSIPEKNERRRKLFQYGFFAFVGFGMLSKGPIAAVLCVGGVLVTAFLAKAPEFAKKQPWVGGFLLSMAIFGPWLYLAEKRTPGFLKYYVIHEHFLRFTKSNFGDMYGPSHTFPHGMIFLFFVAAALPWPWIFFKSARDVYRHHKQIRLKPEMVWLGFGLALLLFYTASRNVVVTYVLPCLPAFALLAGRYLEQHFPKAKARSLNAWWGMAVAVPVVCAAFSVSAGTWLGKTNSTRALAREMNAKDYFGARRVAFYDKMPYSAEFYFKTQLADFTHNAGRLEAVFKTHQKIPVVVLHEDLAFIPASIRKNSTVLLENKGFTVFGDRAAFHYAR